MVDELERRDADGEVAAVAGEREERGLGEAGVGAAVGQADVAADEAQARDVDDAAVDDEHVGPLVDERSGEVLRGWVASSTTAPGAGAAAPRSASAEAVSRMTRSASATASIVVAVVVGHLAADLGGEGFEASGRAGDER